MRDRHAALERARDAEAGAIARLDANPVDSEQVAGEAERLVTWRDQLTALKRRVRIYETTLAAIQAAESMTMRKATRFLEQQVGRDIARLTGGRYRRVSIDDQTLDIQVWAPERGDWVPASRLSKGTIDQVFLAARIGLVRLVTQDRRPPLILDDPFVTFDDTRAARAALLLREISSDFQVIYLACSNRYDGLADSVVELPGPTGEAESAATAPARVAGAEPGGRGTGRGSGRGDGRGSGRGDGRGSARGSRGDGRGSARGDGRGSARGSRGSAGARSESRRRSRRAAVRRSEDRGLPRQTRRLRPQTRNRQRRRRADGRGAAGAEVRIVRRRRGSAMPARSRGRTDPAADGDPFG